MTRRVATLLTILGLIPAVTSASPILLAQLEIASKGTAVGSTSTVPFFLAYYPLIDPTSSETIMLGEPFVPAGFSGHIDFVGPEVDAVSARLTDHIEERLGGSTFGLIVFPPETSPYWGTDAIRDTWHIDFIRLFIKRAEITDRFTDFDYDIDFSWQIYGSGLQAPSVPEPSILVLLGITSIGISRRLTRRART